MRRSATSQRETGRTPGAGPLHQLEGTRSASASVAVCEARRPIASELRAAKHATSPRCSSGGRPEQGASVAPTGDVRSVRSRQIDREGTPDSEPASMPNPRSPGQRRPIPARGSWPPGLLSFREVPPGSTCNGGGRRMPLHWNRRRVGAVGRDHAVGSDEGSRGSSGLGGGRECEGRPLRRRAEQTQRDG